MINTALLNTIQSVLGTSRPTSRGNHAFHCPQCNHQKLKLEINLDESSSNFQNYSCWVCGFRGKSIYSLFKKLNTNNQKIDELKLLVSSSNFDNKPTLTTISQILSLPKEYKSLNSLSEHNIIGKHALNYIKKRGVTEYDILKYNIGYCEDGVYKNRIIIPSYDDKGTLNYFTARSFDNNFLKYKNPNSSRDIIPFELFINWDLPLILCEGPLDSITIKRNAIPLLGKTISPKLMKKIVSSSVRKIYIALDNDAFKQALNFCEQLMNEGKEVYLVELKDKDPNTLGFENFTKLIQTTYSLTFSDLLEKKLYIN